MIWALLDAGADVETYEMAGKHALVTPLTAAISTNSMPIFELLLEREVSIHGAKEPHLLEKQTPYPYNIPLHITVFRERK